MNIKVFRKFKLPDRPGVYFFLGSTKTSGGGRKGSRVLYIGKATSLRDRVKSYFSKDLIGTRGPLLVDMVFKAHSLKWQETDSVLEALILEANLIKKYKPYYNTKEKDDKSWNYVCITKEPLPKVLIERGKNIDLKHLTVGVTKLDAVFGPYTNGSALREALKIIRRIFPFIDTSSIQKDKYQFYRQLGLTPDISEKDVTSGYKKNIKNITLFFQGKKKVILSSLKKEMAKLARDQKFEEANEVKKQLFALEHIRDVSLIKEENLEEGRIKKFRIEAYDIAHMSGDNMVGVMTVVSNGVADKSEYKKFNIRTQTGSNDVGALEEILSRRFRHTEWGLPDLVVVDGSTAQKNMAERVLKRYQFSIPVVAVVKNERHKPERLLGDKVIIHSRERAILLANAEAHRFGITFHKQKRDKQFLNKI